MVKRNENGKLRMRLIRVFAVLMILCLAAFTFVACGKDEGTSSSGTPSYTKTEIDNGVISNASFEFGSAGLELTDFPQTAPKNWSITTDNSARSSYVSSGIVNVSEDGWKELLSTLYDDNDFLQYSVKKYNIDLDQIKTNNNNDSKLVKEDVLEILATEFASPSTHNDQSGNKVLMVNNYLDSIRYGQGTAQKATSSSSITIKKGTSAKITVWVKTKNIVGSGKYGANIKINTIVNSVSTNSFAIYGITDTDWTAYSFYVTGDAKYDATVSLVLGLGFGSTKGSDFTTDYTEGTAFFDDITYEIVDTVPSATTYSVDLTKKDTVYVASTTPDPVFNLSVTDAIFAYGSNVINFGSNATVAHGFHTSHVTQNGAALTSQTVLGTANSTVDEVNVSASTIEVADLVNASYSLSITSDLFEVTNESYAYVSFNVINNLGRFDKNGVTVYVYDFDGTEEIVTSVGKVGYDDGVNTQFNLLVKNNFPEIDTDNIYPETRSFKIKIVIGLTDITTATSAVDFSSGSVTISDMRIHSGNTYQYERLSLDDTERETDEPYKTSTKQLDDYSVYSFISSACSDKVVSLYAGNSKDFSTSSSSFSINTAPSDYGTITYAPAVMKGYEGIDADHVYITDESTNSDINTRTGKVDGRIDHAGVINSKYLAKYATLDGLNDIVTALNHNGSDDIQPLMIYNNNKSSYGFIGTPVSVSASAYASVSLKVRVVGNDAKAFIYLVDTSSSEKNVMNIAFTANTDGYNYVTGGEKYDNKLAFEVTADMMDKTGTDKGWLTLTFYVAAGKTPKNFRLEIWNGDRTGTSTSAGYVFVDNIVVTTASAFSEPVEWTSAFTSSSSVLYNAFNKDASILDNAVYYKRVLDKTEVQYNNEQEDAENKVTYDATYVWAKNDSTIYAIYNTIDPVAVDPYAADVETEEEAKGCAAKSDPSTFWLSFSSIFLIVALVLALLMLVVKYVLRKRKKDKKVRSGYNVSSRYSAKKSAEKAKKVKKDNTFDEYEDEKVEEPEETAEEYVEEPIEQVVESPEETAENTEEKTLDEFVYGDVQDFGDYEDNSDKPE